MQSLTVWVNGLRAGEWRIPRRGNEEFQYADDWRLSEEGRPISLSLPFSPDNAPIKGAAVANYFDNLLPDSNAIRQRIQGRFGIESRRAFDLLSAIGRDCVGAVQLLPSGEKPEGIRSIAAKALTSAQVETRLNNTLSPARIHGAAEDDFRISIAGAQEKTAFLRHNNRWCEPAASTPTTHIFKLPLGLVGGRKMDMRTSVENEWLCSRIVAAFGIPIAPCEIGRFGETKTLIVERFDRQLHSSGKYWLRLVQEDFCQALGLPSSRKYEADGGPGLPDLARVLRGSVNRDGDLQMLLAAQIVFWMLAAGDGHAKNFSLRILSQGRYQLTPLYDVLSFWPIVGKSANDIARQDLRMALALRGKNKHYKMGEIQRRHFNETAALMGIGKDAEALIEALLVKVPDAVEAAQRGLPRDFPQDVLDKILSGLTDSAKRLAAMKP
ncbi:MAG TPA: type II toxin-antitoxin system HipA family toxin [Burkholderiales bacterium]|nr:type II toxin-antitoxin system HipA family toxin [Burkholderiales bacterium]